MRNAWNALKGYKTLLINTLTIVAGLMEGKNLIDVIPADRQPYLVVALAAVNIVLRLMTSTPAGRKE